MTNPNSATVTANGSAPRQVILCRYGEIFLKGGNRHFFEKKLIDNLRRAVGVLGARVERLHGRVLVWPADGQVAVDKTVAALSRIFGLLSVSPARIVPRELAIITEAAIAEARAAVADRVTPPTFKVEARRSDKSWSPSSPEVARHVGGAIAEALGLPVDVRNPQLSVGVEIGFENAFVYAGVTAAPGGLPIGVTGRVDLLLSGGIDSPVAGWMAMKRGCHVAATYFHSFPHTGDKTKDKVARLARSLARWQGEVELRVVPFTAAQVALRDAGDPRLAVVLYRRMMMRVATRLAQARGAQALVTGEALGQVASQTLENMTVIEQASGLPVLRPLVTHDKVETIAWARRIDTYELSIEPYEDCCSLFVPDHPETKARLGVVEEIEKRIDVPALVEACVAGVERIHCAPL